MTKVTDRILAEIVDAVVNDATNLNDLSCKLGQAIRGGLAHE